MVNPNSSEKSPRSEEAKLPALRFYSGRFYAAWVYPDHVHTMLYEGSETRGYPPTGDGFLSSARALGYGEDVYWHMVEHDLLHSLVAEIVYDTASAALYAQAHDEDAWLKPSEPLASTEEEIVGAAQAALNQKEWGFDKLDLSLGYILSQELVFDALEKLRPDGQAMTSRWSLR